MTEDLAELAEVHAKEAQSSLEHGRSYDYIQTEALVSIAFSLAALAQGLMEVE